MLNKHIKFTVPPRGPAERLPENQPEGNTGSARWSHTPMFRGGEYSTRPRPKTNRQGRESLSSRYQPHSVQVHASILSEGGSLPNSRPARVQNGSSTPAGQRPSSAHRSGTPLPAEAPPRPRPAARSAPVLSAPGPAASTLDALRSPTGTVEGGGGTEGRWRLRADIGAASPNPGAGADEAARLGPAALRNASWGDPGGGAWPCSMPAPRLE